jgi:uncharacterized protein (DUF1015 family)
MIKSLLKASSLELETARFDPHRKHQFAGVCEFTQCKGRGQKAFVFQNSLREVWTQILYEMVLSPLLAIGDLRDGERIEYVSGGGSLVIKNN